LTSGKVISQRAEGALFS